MKKYSGKTFLSSLMTNVVYAGETKAGCSLSYNPIRIQMSLPVCIPLNTNIPFVTILYLAISTPSKFATVGINVLSRFIPITG